MSPAGSPRSSAPGVDFGLEPDAPEARRRERLAAWICSSRNPLFARVVVNRLWQAHFGTGFVETASDFGFNGGKPSHPGVARLAGQRDRRAGLEPQGDAPADPEFGRVPAVVAIGPGRRSVATPAID